jgi:hypothetical protein
MGLEEARKNMAQAFGSGPVNPDKIDTNGVAPKGTKVDTTTPDATDDIDLDNNAVEAAATEDVTTGDQPAGDKPLQQMNNQELEDFLDLSADDKKVKIDGKIFTVAELKKSMLLHKDYTKKTQQLSKEQKDLASEKLFVANVDIDIEKVLKNPQAYEAQFYKIYPPKYQRRYEQEKMRRMTGQSAPEGGGDPNASQDPFQQNMLKFMRDVDSRLTTYEEDTQLAKTQREEARLDAAFTRLSAKFDLGDEAANQVLHDQVVQAALQLGHDPSPEDLTKLYQDGFKVFDNFAKTRGSNTYKAQKDANRRASDIGAGGGTPSAAPVTPRTLKGARKAYEEWAEQNSQKR